MKLFNKVKKDKKELTMEEYMEKLAKVGEQLDNLQETALKKLNTAYGII